MKISANKVFVIFLFSTLILMPIDTSKLIMIENLNSKISFGLIDNDHDPIHINGNNEFIYENGVTRGSGIVEDPYIIENWIIKGNGIADYGIFIQNTDAFFIINNCTISDFNNAYVYGIYFKNVDNGCITSSSSFDNAGGIGLKESYSIKIENCSCVNNNDFSYSTGIFCWDSQNVGITFCNISGNSYGVDFTDTSTSEISNSFIYDNENTGILLYGKNSKYNFVDFCEVLDNGNIGIDIYCDDYQASTYNSISNCVITQNGLPNGGANGYPGIGIWISSDNLIENCMIEGNGRGIGIDSSKNNIIRNCTISKHSNNEDILSDGIVIVGGLIPRFITRNNRIFHCDIMDNEMGALIGFSFGTIFYKNNIINNSYNGIMSWSFSICIIKNNNIIHNGYELNISRAINSAFFSYFDARFNWWGSEEGPNLFGVNDGSKIGRKFSIVRFRPWLKELVPDAGRQT